MFAFVDTSLNSAAIQNDRKGKLFEIGYNYFCMTSPRGSSIL
mgnify:CR=1 FL=1